MKRILIVALFAVTLTLSFAMAADCEESTADCYNQGASMSSSDFRILDPQHAAFGGTASSSSATYRLLGAIGDLAIGSSSATTYGVRAGFLYFPLIVSPDITGVTTTQTSATVTWTQLRSGLTTAGGLTNTTYQVCSGETSPPTGCASATPGSTNVGSLDPSTLYYFRVKAFDYYGNLIAESDIRSATTQSSGGGGGGGGGYVPPGTRTFSGLAFPFGTVHILYNGAELGSAPTNADAEFTFSSSILPNGATYYGFWGTDRFGRRSITWSFSLPSDAQGRISGLIIPPTIAVSALSVPIGTPITIVGESVPGGTIEATMLPVGRTATTPVASNGSYSVQLATTGLAAGVYDIKARVLLLPGLDQSTWSQVIQVGVGVPAPSVCNHPPDVNNDGRVDLVDFSILAYWWGRNVDATNPSDLNCDGTVNLADFSILAYHWTGR